MPYVYHASETSGIKEFVPRKFWHIHFERSGPVTKDSDIPPNAGIITCFYASSEDYVPFYYPPQDSRRLYVWRQKNPEKFGLVAQVFEHIESDRILIFDKKDHSSIESHVFYVYAFDSEDFQRLPNGEYVAHQTVVPLKETRHENALKHLLQAGYQVEFVMNLYEMRKALLDLELIVDSEGV